MKVSYSYKTNREVGEVLQSLDGCEDVDFSIHSRQEIKDIEDKEKIWFFLQAELEEDLKSILNKNVRNFVVDNEVDLERLLEVINSKNIPISLSLRMKFKEHRIGTGKYFVYGMPSRKVNRLIEKLEGEKLIDRLGVHIHRKTQNTSEWKIVKDLKDSLIKDSLNKIDFVNLGGGLPSIYRSSSVNVFDYIFKKLREANEWLSNYDIEAIIEPGRFIAAPAVRLETEIIQRYRGNLIVNTTVYNGAMDSILTNTKMLVEGEIKKGEEGYKDGKNFLIKGNSPTRDDIFRYRARLPSDIKVGDKIVFLNAGAYNYTTDFFGFKKLSTVIKESF